MMKTTIKKSKRSGRTPNRAKLASASRRRISLKNRKKKRLVRKVGLVTLAMFGILTFASLIGVVYGFTYLQRLNEEIPSPDQPFKDPPVSTVIYDRNAIENIDDGKQLYRVIGEENADRVDIEEVPDIVRWAFLAAEDVEFYTHDGFDTEGIVRCGLNYVSSSGGSFCGGSTITQQLVKITTKDTETSISRKIRELFLATKVEQVNDKDTILEMYLTVAPFGSNIRGLTTAAKFYFDKEPSELTLAEAAVLSAIVQNPSYLSPTKPIDGDTARAQADVTERQEYVLDQLEDNMKLINNQTRINKDNPEMEDILTPEKIAKAREQEMKYRPPVATDKIAGHFVDFVLEELVTKPYNEGEPFTLEELQTGGYKVYTTLDYGLQKIAEEEVAVGGSKDYWNINNAALVTLKPDTGEVITMAGSKNFVGEKQGCDADGANCLYDPEVNVLTTLQSAGSTHKVLTYYSAFEKGVLAPGSFLPDIPLAGIPGYGPEGPRNWDSSFQGLNLTAKEALRKSRNIPAIIALEAQGGPANYVDVSKKFGYTTFNQDPANYGYSVTLGGYDVYPIEHAQAFTTFANGGDFVPYESVLKIEKQDGTVVYETKPERTRVANPQAVYLLNQALYNLENSYGYPPVSWDGRDIAAKTGTSQDNRDSWVVAWTPDMVTLGWAGNNNNSPMDAANGFPGQAVSPWLDSYMSRIGSSKYFNAKTPFSRPANVYQGTNCSSEEGVTCEHLRGADWLIQGKEPPGYIQTQEFSVCKDQQDKLAREIDKKLGLAINKTIKSYIMPASSWQQYLDKHVSQGENVRPTEECTVDRFGGNVGPIFDISNPKNGATVNNNVTVAGGIFSNGGAVNSAKVYLNGTSVGSITGNLDNFDKTFSIGSLGLSNGTYPFRIDVTDAGGNSGSYNVNVVVGSATSNDFSFSLPSSPLKYGTDVGLGNTQPITVNYTGGGSISNVKLYQISSDGTAAVGTMTAGGGGSFSIQWGSTLPAPTPSDQYRFYVEASSGGGTITSKNSGNVTVSL